MNEMMAVRMHAQGGPGVLRLDSVPRPAPTGRQLLIKTAAIGVNFADIASRRGDYPALGAELPAVPGFEAAGVVEAVGPDGSAYEVGQRVAAMVPGAYAEYVVAEPEMTFPLPDDVSTETGAGLFAQGLTAFGMLRAARVQPSDRVLVLAAAGGVGSLAVQIAKLMGVETVIGAAGSPHKLEAVRAFGADRALDYSAPGWSDDVGQVDVVLDLVGGSFPDEMIPLLASGTGRVVLGGMSAGIPHVDAAALVGSGVSAIGFTVPAWTSQPGFAQDAVGSLLRWAAEGRLTVTVGATYPLAEADKAHEAVEARRTTGKVLLIPGGNADVADHGSAA